MATINYQKDANLLIKHSQSSSHRDIIPRTELPNSAKTKKDVLPFFTYIIDGWRNFISGMGGKNAKNMYTTYQSNYCISDYLLHSLFQNNGISRKISKSPADDATKNDIYIKGDIDNKLFDKWSMLDGISEFNLADFYRRHYGGSLIVMGINDSREIWEPLNTNTIRSIDWLKTYSRTDVYFTNIHFQEDVNSPNYGQPEFYTVVPKYTTPFNVHYTRVIQFKGFSVPTELDAGYKYYWGMSVIEPLWETLKKCGASLENLDQLLYELTIGIYKIKDLAKLMSEGRWDDIKKIIDSTDLSKSVIRSLLLDSEDNYERDSLTFTGIKDVIEIIMTFLSGESEIPVSRLFGKQLGGLNNEGEAELRSYYDMVKAHQKNDLTKPTQKLINIINISKEFKGKVKNPIVSYNSPWQLTEKEELENKKIQAEIDGIYIDKAVLSDEEVRESRFANGYSYDTQLMENEIDESELEMSVEGE